MLSDEKLWSPRRLFGAVRQWLYYVTREPPIRISLWGLLKYHHRPWASDRDGFY